MISFTTSELLDAWEKGVQRPLAEKALCLLQLTDPLAETAELWKWPVGRRDERLIGLREWLFGSRLLNVAVCPSCSLSLEWETDLGDMRLPPPLPSDPLREYLLEADAFRIRFRLPNSLDLSLAGSGNGYDDDPNKLLYNCILEAHRHGKKIGPEELPAPVIDALDRQMAEMDPQADIRMKLACAGCGWQWETHFDIVSYLWTEVDSWSRHILQEVCLLAEGLGWSEADILRLSPFRRRMYLELLGV